MFCFYLAALATVGGYISETNSFFYNNNGLSGGTFVLSQLAMGKIVNCTFINESAVLTGLNL